MYVAERIRKYISEHRFKAYDLELNITASIGFATFNPNIREESQIVEWADSALYQAKRQGKNRVCAYINP
jgi:diguanylate cyclase